MLSPWQAVDLRARSWPRQGLPLWPWMGSLPEHRSQPVGLAMNQQLAVVLDRLWGEALWSHSNRGVAGRAPGQRGAGSGAEVS